MTAQDADRADGLPRAQVTAGGVTYQVVVPHHETDYIQGNLVKTGQPYELGMLEAMGAQLEPGDLVLDIGANIGNHTLYLAIVAGCRVVAFEPNRALADALSRSATQSDVAGRIEVRTCALGAEPGRGSLANLDEANLGGQTVAVDPAHGDFEVAVLDRVTLPGPVRAMKIDVEGMELDVLAGAEELVARDRPDLYIEAIDGAAFDRLAAWMLAHDYCYDATYNATPTHRFRPGTPAERELSTTLMRVVREAYDLRGEALEMRRARDAASLKVREVRRQQTEARDHHQQRMAELRAKHERETAELRTTIKTLRRRVRRQEQELSTLRDSRAVRTMRVLREARTARRLALLPRDLVRATRRTPALPAAERD